MRRRLVIALVVSAAATTLPARAAAQAFTPPGGAGSVTLAWQFVDNTGHRFSDGFFRARGQSVTTSVLAEVEYAPTDRLALSFGVPFVGAKYTGAQPPLSGLAVDQCACWNASFQDVAAGVRYRMGSGVWAVTPLVRLDVPTHDYQYQGEAVVGRNLRELQVGLGGGLLLTRIAPSLSVQATYAYAFVEKALDDVSVNRSNGVFDVGYTIASRLHLRGTAAWQFTHGGLRAGSETGNPFPLPGELNTPERRAQRDRLLKVKYWQLGGGGAYSLGPVDLFGSFAKYVWGRDAHNGWVYNTGVTYYFDVGRGTASFARQPAHGRPAIRARDGFRAPGSGLR